MSVKEQICTNNEKQNVFSTNKFNGKNYIGKNVFIHNSYIENSKINNNVKIYNAVVKNSDIDEWCKIENFVEIINSKIGKNNLIKSHSSIIDKIIKDNNNIKPKFFGTDGIRGIWGEDLTQELVQKVAKSLCYGKAPKVIVGRDTRKSGEEISNIFIKTLLENNATVFDLSICSTPAIAFLTKNFECDWGVMITASHNSEIYNGIKIFNNEGRKLNQLEEYNLEQLFYINNNNLQKNTEKMQFFKKKTQKYENFIKLLSENSLNELKIVLDVAGGGTKYLAPKIFKNLYAKVFVINSDVPINKNCGSLEPKGLQNSVLRFGADLGFAFDGDGDRVIAVNRKGQVLNGDEILYILTWYYKKLNLLNKNCVVGTILTNLGIENKLKGIGVKLERVDVGDKHIIKKLQTDELLLGGEQVGHIIIRNLLPSGDGILIARILCGIYLENKHIFESVKDNKYVQISKEILLDKEEQKELIDNPQIIKIIDFYKSRLGDNGRIIVRPSGTENKIRIMVESGDKNICNLFALELKKRLLRLIKINS